MSKQYQPRSWSSPHLAIIAPLLATCLPFTTAYRIIWNIPTPSQAQPYQTVNTVHQPDLPHPEACYNLPPITSPTQSDITFPTSPSSLTLDTFQDPNAPQAFNSLSSYQPPAIALWSSLDCGSEGGDPLMVIHFWETTGTQTLDFSTVTTPVVETLPIKSFSEIWPPMKVTEPDGEIMQFSGDMWMKWIWNKDLDEGMVLTNQETIYPSAIAAPPAALQKLAEDVALAEQLERAERERAAQQEREEAARMYRQIELDDGEIAPYYVGGVRDARRNMERMVPDQADDGMQGFDVGQFRPLGEDPNRPDARVAGPFEEERDGVAGLFDGIVGLQDGVMGLRDGLGDYGMGL